MIGRPSTLRSTARHADTMIPAEHHKRSVRNYAGIMRVALLLSVIAVGETACLSVHRNPLDKPLLGSPPEQVDITNRTIAERVKTATILDPDVRGNRIHVWVMHDTVFLTGEVGSPFERNKAGALALEVPGVSTVVNRLIDPTRWTWNYDWLIRGRIERELSRRPHVSEDVGVTVNDSVATITGTVQAADDRRMLEEIALESGAVEIDDRLKISPSTQ